MNNPAGSALVAAIALTLIGACSNGELSQSADSGPPDASGSQLDSGFDAGACESDVATACATGKMAGLHCYTTLTEASRCESWWTGAGVQLAQCGGYSVVFVYNVDVFTAYFYDTSGALHAIGYGGYNVYNCYAGPPGFVFPEECARGPQGPCVRADAGSSDAPSD